MTASTPLSVLPLTTFQIPNDLFLKYNEITFDRYVAEAERLMDKANDFINNKKTRVDFEQGYDGQFAWHNHCSTLRKYMNHRWLTEGTPKLINLNYVKKQSEECVELAAKRFEMKVEGWLLDGDKITGHNLALNGALIQGSIFGIDKEGNKFYIQAKMMWNYRYGSNSANGVLTQYVQFREERH